MNIKQRLRQVLSDTEILALTADAKVYFIHANNARPPYVEYEIADEYGVFHAEGKERAASYLVQVDIFSEGDYTALEDKIKERMISAGFVRDSAADMYEEDTRLYHKAMRFTYFEMIEEV